MDRDLSIKDAWLNIFNVKEIIVSLREAIKSGIEKGSIRIYFNEYYNNEDELCYEFGYVSYCEAPHDLETTVYLWSYYNLEELYYDFMREFEYSLWHTWRES